MESLSHFFISVNSIQSKDTCDYNTPSFFTVLFDTTFNFSVTDYEVALMDLSCTSIDDPPRQLWKPIHINLDIVEGQNVFGREQRLLRYTCIKRGKYYIEKFNPPYYVPVSKISTDEMTFHINNAESGTQANSLSDITALTLHFRKRRRLWLTA